MLLAGVRHPRIMLTSCAAICILAGSLFLNIPFNTTPEALLEGDARSLATYELVKEALDNEGVLLISMECEDVFTLPNLQAMFLIGQSFLSNPHVIDVKSITHAALPYREGMRLKFKPYLPDDLSPENLKRTRAFSLSHPLVRNLLISEDGRHAIIAVTYQPGYFDAPETRQALRGEIQKNLSPHTTETRQFRTISVPEIRVELESIAARDTKRFLLISSTFLLGAILFYFRNWRLLAFVFWSVLCFAGACIAVAALTPIPLGISALALIPLLLAVELTLLAYVSRAFLNEYAKQPKLGRAAAQAVRYSARSCLFATITTSVGLLSLLTSGLKGARTFGIVGAIGVIIGLFVVFGPGMALIMVLFKNRPVIAFPPPFPLSKLFGQRLLNRRRSVTVVLLLITLLLLPGLTQLRTDINVTHMIPPQSTTRRNADNFERIYKGRNFMHFLIESGKKNGAAKHAFLQYAMNLERYAMQQEGVTGCYSLASIMAMVNQVWNNWEEGSYALPGPMLLTLFSTMIDNSPFPFAHVLTDEDWSACNLYVRTGNMETAQYMALVKTLNVFAEENLPEGIRLSMGPGLHHFIRADSVIRESQAKSLVFALAVITVVLALLWRSIKLAVTAAVVTGIPAAVTLGIAGYAKIPLNAVTFTVAAIAVGIAVDDVVHFVTYWQERWQHGHKPPLQETLLIKGSPIVFTSILLAGLFASFATITFPPIRQFGLLTAIAFSITLAAVLVVLPLMLTPLKRA